MVVQEIYLVGINRCCFRAGEPARVVGVKAITQTNNIVTVNLSQEPVISYHIRFEDGQEDYVAKSDVEDGNWKFVTLSNLISTGIPELTD